MRKVRETTQITQNCQKHDLWAQMSGLRGTHQEFSKKKFFCYHHNKSVMMVTLVLPS